MLSKRFTVVIVASHFFVFAIGLGLGLIRSLPSEMTVTVQAQEMPSPMAIRELMTQMPTLAEQHQFGYEEIILHSLALAEAEPCAYCDPYQEWTGAQDYYTVPLITRASNDYGDGAFTIVPAEMQMQYVEDFVPDTVFAPRLGIYAYTRGGIVLRVDEAGRVSRRYSFDREGKWKPEDDERLVRVIRHAALDALLKGNVYRNR
jgi:hypothetical protein